MKQKRIREHEAQLKAENELKERQRLEQMKQEFIERIQATQAERAKIMKQKREEKERIRQARDEFLRHEREKEKNEIKLMYAEDTRREENLEKQRKKILQFGQQMTQINEKIKRPHSASSSGVRKKLMSHLQREDILADGEVEEEKVTEMKKPELPKVPKVIKKVPPPLSKEEEERLRLEKEEQERERIRQQVDTPSLALL